MKHIGLLADLYTKQEILILLYSKAW